MKKPLIAALHFVSILPLLVRLDDGVLLETTLALTARLENLLPRMDLNTVTTAQKEQSPNLLRLNVFLVLTEPTPTLCALSAFLVKWEPLDLIFKQARARDVPLAAT